MNDEYVQYFIVNKTLSMSKGKVAAQVAHGATISTMVLGHLDYFKEWFNKDQKKIVLQGSENDMWKILANVMDSYKVVDNGLTEIPEGSMTVIVIPPMKRSEAQKYIKRLQLLKD
jgi:peptidyl-tRNA hydrolase, PTH2 family